MFRSRFFVLQVRRAYERLQHIKGDEEEKYIEEDLKNWISKLSPEAFENFQQEAALAQQQKVNAVNHLGPSVLFLSLLASLFPIPPLGPSPPVFFVLSI